MAQIGQVEDRHAEKLEEGIAGRGHAVFELDGVRDHLPVRMRQLAVGHRAVDHLEAALAGFQQHARRKQKGLVGAVGVAAERGAQSLRTVSIVKPRRVHVQAHIAVGGVDQHVGRTAADLKVALGLKLGRRAVIDHLVGAQRVAAIVKDDVAGEGERVADQRLVVGIPVDGQTGGGDGLGFSDRQQFLARIVRKLMRNCTVGRHGVAAGGSGEGLRGRG
jgi:hypothetical protein